MNRNIRVGDRVKFTETRLNRAEVGANGYLSMDNVYEVKRILPVYGYESCAIINDATGRPVIVAESRLKIAPQKVRVTIEIEADVWKHQGEYHYATNQGRTGKVDMNDMSSYSRRKIQNLLG